MLRLAASEKGRFTFDVMEQAIRPPRPATRVTRLEYSDQNKPDKIRDVIGRRQNHSFPVEETGAKMTFQMMGPSRGHGHGAAAEAWGGSRMQRRRNWPELLVLCPESSIFGIWSNFPGTDGLLHISEIADRRVKDVRDELKEGQQILVKCIGKEGNKIKLSRKAVLRDEERKAEAASAGDSD